MNENTNRTEDGWEVIATYTRAQAIEDGVLVDMTQGDLGELLAEAGFKLHTAMTVGAYGAAIGTEPPSAGQDIKGRWWDVLMVLRHAIAGNRNTDRVHFTVGVFDGKRSNEVQLWALVGPGDDARPAITIMLEGED